MQPRRETLVARLALLFGAHPENLATEALNYVLQQSLTARTALIHLSGAHAAGLDGDDLPADLRFQTQVAGEDQAIPDLVGASLDGTPHLIVEAKFWAGLTENQPVQYLRRLPAGRRACLMVVAPLARFPTLWSELLRRCVGDGIDVAASHYTTSNHSWLRVNDRHVLLLVSWARLLDAIALPLEHAGEREVLADVRQLAGLCERMDTEAFLPIRSEELFAVTPRRAYQFTYLVDDLATMAIEAGYCSSRGLRVTSARGEYGRYLRIGTCGTYLHTDLRKWFEVQPTPFWLRIHGADWRHWQKEWDRLSPLEHETPPRLVLDSSANVPVIPLYPPLGEERDAVLQALLAQFREVHDLLTRGDTDTKPLNDELPDS